MGGRLPVTMIDTGIKLSDMSTAWGLVQCVNKDGTIAREYVISAAAADAVRDGKREHPPGCTLEEWRTGRVFLFSRPLHPGLALRSTKDGSLMVNYGVRKVGGRVLADVLVIPAAQWELVGRDSIRLPARLARIVDLGHAEVLPDVED